MISKSNLKKYAPLGLYLALAAALTAVGLFVVRRTFDLPLQISLALIVAGLAVYTLLDPESVLKTLTGRQARYGSNALIMGLALLGILVVVNYLAYQNPVRWDLTETKLHTLAPETIEVLNSLEQPVVAQAFYSSQYPYSTDTARNLLESFKINSNGNFEYEFIDPDANPIAAQQANIIRDGTIVMFIGDRQEQVTSASEQNFASALLRLKNPGERVVYFLTGHGEFDPQGSGETALSMAHRTLETKNYTINSLNLLTTSSVPDDALAVIIAAPQQPLEPREIAALQNYQEAGGSLVVLVEPSLSLEASDTADPLLDYLSSQWGITARNDLLLDPNVNPPLIAIAETYGDHTITSRLEGMATVYPTARSLMTDSVPENVTVTSLATTSQFAWGETDLESLQTNEVGYDEASDITGPVDIAVAATNNDTNARLVVVGDADFATDSYFTSYGDGDFLINVIDWAAQQDDLINLTPRTPTTRFLVPPQQSTMGLLFLALIIGMPGLVVAFGIVSWVQRKSRG